MVASDSFAEFLREQLAPLGLVTMRRMFGKLCCRVSLQRIAPLAQLDRAPGFEPGGRGFESCEARQRADKHLRRSTARSDTVAFILPS